MAEGTRYGDELDDEYAWHVSFKPADITNDVINHGDQDSDSAKYYVIAVRGSSNGTIKLPKTGQQRSDETGDDGNLQKGAEWPVPRFVDNGDATITDTLTGLMWQQWADTTERKWENSIGYCNSLTLAGYNDWRLPNVLELESLFHAGKKDNRTWLENQGFKNLETKRYWTSTINMYNHLYSGDDEALVMWISAGGILYEDRDDSFYVLAVRDAE